MESTEELQQHEITALRSIYAEDFIDTPPPKAWKGAARLPEFIIRVPHPDPKHATKVSFYLHVKFPKTYPIIACPTFTIEKPIVGLTNDHVTRLSHALHNEAQHNKGSEMVFSVVTFAQDWLTSNVVPPVDVPGSLAVQMTKRALDEEQARKQREAAEAEEMQERASQMAAQLNEQIRADAQRQQIAKEKQFKARNRANSEATAVPDSGDTPTETFNQVIELDGIRFHTVRLFHPRKDCLGTVYLADPICDDGNATLALELLCVSFESQYYTTTQGRKKLKQVETEIQRLTSVRHPNLLSVYAAKLLVPHSSGPPQLFILSEQFPSMTLQDVLYDCDSLREERASDYLAQVLSALNVVHAAEIVHRGVTTQCIGLAPRGASKSKLVKLGKAGYYTRLLDLHKSNPFGPNVVQNGTELQLPENWMSKEVADSPLVYTRTRDLHAVGIVLLQMLMGHDVVERFPDVLSAIQSSSMSPAFQQHALNLLVPTKKNHVSCLSILADLAGTSFHAPRRSPAISYKDPRTPMPLNISSSPEQDYFRAPPQIRQSSRWKEDWEELELLGKGAFGSVVKARNKIDSRIYAVKKIKLRTTRGDTKISREVNALSRLSHRFIVRYYTTWLEVAEPTSAAVSDDSASESGTTDGMTSVPASKENGVGAGTGALTPSFNINGISIDLSELDDHGSSSHSSFPSIHFGRSHSRSSSPKTDEEDSSGSDEFGNLFRADAAGDAVAVNTPPPMVLTMYIQMEFVERQTLKERVAEGITEDEAWRLFQQIVDALVHMSTLGILHRDIKLTNIFIDVNGDCKVGDFGLATSSLAAVDPSDVSPHIVAPESDMTLEVGTKLYIAPEVQSRKRGPRNHSKADLYSLGIVFFEMNYKFSTASERIAVIENLRKPSIIFPGSWEPHLTRQKQIITWLLQHDPNDRPTALELSQSPLLPPRLEDEYFKGAMRMMAKPDSPHYQAVLSSLFSQPPRLSRGFLYDLEADLPEHTSLNDIVHQRLGMIFRTHGAVDMEPPLLMPVMDADDEKTQATFLDRHGDIVTLPNNTFVPFARLAARTSAKRIKRYHINDIYKPSAIPGHPKVTKAAIFDIITPDLEAGPVAAGAEILTIASECLDSFPNLTQMYDIHVSHSNIVQVALNRIPENIRNSAIEIMSQAKSSPSQKRALLLKKGILRSTIDELEALADTDEDVDFLIAKVEKISPSLVALINAAVDEVKKTIQFAGYAGVTRTIYFHPLMLGSHHAHITDGLRFEVVRRNRRVEVLASGGRYDNLISRYSPPKPTAESVCAVGIQIAVEKITAALAAFQSTSVKTLVKEQKSFGFWSPRRCDVYIVSYHPGYLQDRLEVAAHLWQHNISADIMYESGLPDAEHENYVDLCIREGILFTVYPRPRAARRDQTAFKVKSILKGAEVELSKQELVGWLQQQIAEQKRIDISASGAPLFSDKSQHVLPNKDAPVSPDVQLLLPIDTKKQRKQVKQIFLDRAFETGVQVKSALQNDMYVLAVDVLPVVFSAMTKSAAWITDEESWKTVLAAFPPQHSAYAHQIREAIAKRKADGHPFMLLFAVREESVQLLALS